MIHTKNRLWLIAGGLNLGTAFLHTFGGQLDLVDPLLKSNLKDQPKAEWFAAWHMITILLFATSFYVLKNAFSPILSKQSDGVFYLGILYVLLSLPFIASSIIFQLLVPQWIILLPIGILMIWGSKKLESK